MAPPPSGSPTPTSGPTACTPRTATACSERFVRVADGGRRVRRGVPAPRRATAATSGSATSATPCKDVDGVPDPGPRADGRDHGPAKALEAERDRDRGPLPPRRRAPARRSSTSRRSSATTTCPGAMLYVSPQVEAILGFTPERVDGRPARVGAPVPPGRPRRGSARSTSASSAPAVSSAPSTGCTRATATIRWIPRRGGARPRRRREPRCTGRGSCSTSPPSARREERARESEDRYRRARRADPRDRVLARTVTGDGLAVDLHQRSGSRSCSGSAARSGSATRRLARRRSTPRTARGSWRRTSARTEPPASRSWSSTG